MNAFYNAKVILVVFVANNQSHVAFNLMWHSISCGIQSHLAFNFVL
jgi:uncharacterized integral membrane protein